MAKPPLCCFRLSNEVIEQGFSLHRMSPEVAHSDASRQRSTSVAFGAKRTLTRPRGERPNPTSHRPDRLFADRLLWNVAPRPPGQSALMPVNFTTLPHFSVSSVMSLPKSAGESASTSPPSSASRALILGSARPALIASLSLSIICDGVPLGAPMPYQALAS